MNDAILKFRRYEDASLAYTGVNRHATATRVGLMDSTVPHHRHAKSATGIRKTGPFPATPSRFAGVRFRVRPHTRWRARCNAGKRRLLTGGAAKENSSS